MRHANRGVGVIQSDSTGLMGWIKGIREIQLRALSICNIILLKHANWAGYFNDHMDLGRADFLANAANQCRWIWNEFMVLEN